jgi:hypothetical protein
MRLIVRNAPPPALTRKSEKYMRGWRQWRTLAGQLDQIEDRIENA